MKNILIIFALLSIALISTNIAYSQEMGLATFQETAQVIIDNSISQKVTASITLQSTSIQEIRIPSELEQKVRDNSRIKSVILTNQDQCVLGVVDESCIMINIERNPEDKGIIAIQDSTKEISELYINEINQAFDTNARFHSTYIHTGNELNNILETSGVISGNRMISAVYTMPQEDTSSMYEKISATLIPKIIRESGGFYNIAKDLSYEENSVMTFSLIPLDTKSLLQLKLSIDYPNEAKTISKISPLEFFKIENIKRSDYFSDGFYPLNSIIQIVVLSPESTFVSNVKGEIIPTQIIDDEKIPLEITEKGWIFDPEEGQKIQGKFIFGQETSINQNELKFTLGDEQLELDESTYVVVIISIIAIIAALFYLKGYKRK
ncbi:MAG: hypothetical protein MAG458_01463 [Nitrosopumilus sp.]|nr:hypothetical protein [Nitrosopumilus sp.]